MNDYHCPLCLHFQGRISDAELEELRNGKDSYDGLVRYDPLCECCDCVVERVGQAEKLKRWQACTRTAINSARTCSR